MDHQGPVMVVGEAEVTLKLVPAPSMETSQGPRHSVALVGEGVVIAWQQAVVFFI